jgi:putative DNA primase/helicase
MRVDAYAVRQAAEGRWPEILLRLQAIDGRHLHGRHAYCLGCGGKDRFRFDNRGGRGTWICSQGGGEPLAGDGFDLIQHVHGCGFSEALRRVGDTLGLIGGEPRVPARLQKRPTDRTSESPEPAGRAGPHPNAEAARELWRTARPISGMPAEVYLTGRGLDPDQLGCEPPSWPETLRWSGDADGRGRGALVVAVNRADCGLVGAVHRIFVHPDGSPMRRPDGKKLKLALGPIGRNAARLSCVPHPDGWWALAEGVETALAARQMMGVPTWAAISGSNMANVSPPHWARCAIVFADHDASGAGLQQASKALARIRQHPNIETARVLMARDIGKDAADLLKGVA